MPRKSEKEERAEELAILRKEKKSASFPETHRQLSRVYNQDRKVVAEGKKLLKEMKALSVSSARQQRAPKVQRMMTVAQQPENSPFRSLMAGQVPGLAMGENAAPSMLRSVVSNLRKSNPDMLKTNAYLASLLNPEKLGKGVGVPDCYPDPTFRYRSVFDIKLDQSYFSSDGTLVTFFCPDMASHLYLPATVEVKETYNVVNLRSQSTGQLVDHMLTDLATGDTVTAELRRVLFMGSYEDSNDTFISPGFNIADNSANTFFANISSGVPFPLGPMLQEKTPPGAVEIGGDSMWTFGAKAVADAPKWLFPSSFTDTNANLRIGLPFVVFDGGSVYTDKFDINCDIHINGMAPTDPTPNVYVLFTFSGYSAALGSDVSFSVWAAVPAYSITINSNVAGRVGWLASIGLRDIGATLKSRAALAGYAMYDQVFVSVGLAADFLVTPPIEAVDFTIRNLNISLRPQNTHKPGDCGLVDHPAAGYCMKPTPIPQISLFNNGICTAYRMVSGSAWLTYAGSTLNDSGLVYGNYVNDRRPPADRDHSYMSTEALTSLGTTYRGRLPLGAYAWWKPEQESDLQFRRIDTRFNFGRPYTVFVVDQTSQNPDSYSMVIRAAANWEMKTLSPALIGGLRRSIVDPDQITQVFKVLATVPTVMSNDAHESTISNILNTIWGGVKAVGKGVYGAIGRPALQNLASSSDGLESFLGTAGTSIGDFLSSIF